MIRIREARETDAGYIMATALRQVPRFVREVKRGPLEDAIRALVYSSRIVVACAAEDDDALCGWAAGMHATLLFAFVPRELRGAGIGIRLIKAIHGDIEAGASRVHPRADGVGVPAGSRGLDDGDLRSARS